MQVSNKSRSKTVAGSTDFYAHPDDQALAASGHLERMLPVKDYGLHPEFVETVDAVFAKCRDTLLRKHADYGSRNISQSPGGPLNGLRVRMWDKLARVNHLIDYAKPALNESLEDSFLDLANYAVIASMVLSGDWPAGVDYAKR